MLVDFSDKSLYNEKFIPLLHDNKRYNFLMWSAGSGKSVFVAQREIIKSYNKNNKLLCVRKVYATLRDSCFAELKWIANMRGLQDHFKFVTSPLSIENIKTGSQIIFRGMDDQEKIKSVQGVNRIWVEEATELTQQDFDQLDLRLRGKDKMQITASFNPVNVDHFLNTKFWMMWDTDEQTLLHSTFLDNRFVWEKYKQVMERLKLDNFDYYKIYALWERWDLQGRIFNKRNIIEQIPQNARLLWYWLDFWYSVDPASLVEIYMIDWVPLVNELIYKVWLTNTDLDELMRQLWVSKDYCIVADSAEPKSIEELSRMWWLIEPATKGKDSINYGINSMKQKGFNVTGSSSNLIKELRKYTRATNKTTGQILPKPVDVDDHAIDATRYYFQTKLGYVDEIKWSTVVDVQEDLVYDLY